MPEEILIIDDEEQIRKQFSDFLRRLGYTVTCLSNAQEGISHIQMNNPAVVIVDILLPGMSGLDMLKEISQHSVLPEVIVISGHGTLDAAISALRYGAADFIKKPVNLNQLEGAVARCIRKSSSRNNHNVISQNNRNIFREVECIGNSAQIMQCRRMTEVAAQSPCHSILITGETGTGKEVMARLFHQIRYGNKRPFIAENCPAIAESLIESELFGHVKGAFTGAQSDRSGAFEQAHGGTLFLDEIGDLSLNAQAKLLRVLENRTVRRVGSSEEKHIDVTVVAATNCNLAKQASLGKFRQDLFFRLNCFALHLPPLRDRIDDIIPLASFFADRFMPSSSIGGRKITFSDKAKAAMLEYKYPGNARELRNIIERACIISPSSEIGINDLEFAYPEYIKLPEVDEYTQEDETAAAILTGDDCAMGEYLQDEIDAVYQALQKSGWNKSKAARLLGISYDALRWRVKKYQLKEPQSFIH